MLFPEIEDNQLKEAGMSLWFNRFRFNYLCARLAGRGKLQAWIDAARLMRAEKQ
jgi:hypothetical protein